MSPLFLKDVSLYRFLHHLHISSTQIIWQTSPAGKWQWKWSWGQRLGRKWQREGDFNLIIFKIMWMLGMMIRTVVVTEWLVGRVRTGSCKPGQWRWWGARGPGVGKVKSTWFSFSIVHWSTGQKSLLVLFRFQRGVNKREKALSGEPWSLQIIEMNPKIPKVGRC